MRRLIPTLIQAFSTFSRARLNCTRLNLHKLPKTESTGWRLRGWSKPTRNYRAPGALQPGDGTPPGGFVRASGTPGPARGGGGWGDLGRALRPHLPEPSTWAPRSTGASGAGHQGGGEAFLSVNKFVLRNTTPKENFYRKKQD